MVREAAEALRLERARVKAAEEQLRQLDVRARDCFGSCQEERERSGTG